MSCRNSIYILEINPLLDIWLKMYFLPFHGCTFYPVDYLLCRRFFLWLVPFVYFCNISSTFSHKIIANTNFIKLFFYVFFKEFYSFRSYVSEFNTFWVDSGAWYVIRFQFHSFAYGYPVFPIPFVKENVLFSIYIFDTLFKDQMTMNAWVYFWALYSVPLAYMSVCMSILYCFNYYSFVIYYFKSGCIMPPHLFLLSLLEYQSSLLFHIVGGL